MTVVVDITTGTRSGLMLLRSNLMLMYPNIPVKCSYSYSSQRYQDCVASDRGELALEYPGNSASSSTTWATHPAFHWGSQELNGFWFAKYESSGAASETTVLPSQTTYTIYGDNVISQYYDLAKAAGVKDSNNTYGGGTTGITQNSHHLSTAKSHLTKNSEWAAWFIWHRLVMGPELARCK